MRGAKDEEEGNKKDKDQVLKWHKKKYKTFMRRPLPKEHGQPRTHSLSKHPTPSTLKPSL
jgi:hypothetical protein